MALVSVNAPRGQRSSEGTLDKVLKGIQITEGLLGVGLAIPKMIQERRLTAAKIDKTEADTSKLEHLQTPTTPEEQDYYRQKGISEASLPQTVEQAQAWDKRMYETPGQKASREKTDAMLGILASKESRERKTFTREENIASQMPVLTPLEEKVDERFATTYEEWNASGGYSQSQKNLKQARWAVKELMDAAKKGKNYSGKDVGIAGGKVKAFAYPDAAEMEENVQQIVTANLRQALGAQFTEKEGTRIMNQTFNPMLDEKVNAKRLERLIEQLSKQFEAKQKASEYYEANRTLKGWKGPLLQVGDFTPAPTMNAAEDF